MKTKNAGLRVRVERELREDFLGICRSQDKPAAQVIREFVRDYVAWHTADAARAPAPRKRKGTR